jgi:hypothetical protein
MSRVGNGEVLLAATRGDALKLFLPVGGGDRGKRS